MKTKHIYSNDLNAETCRELRRLGTMQNYLRIVTCGKAVIILPDTNTSKDCSLSELLKAMHCEDCKEELTRTETKRYFIKDNYNEENLFLEASPKVVEFIEYCLRNDYFTDDISFLDPNKMEALQF